MRHKPIICAIAVLACLLLIYGAGVSKASSVDMEKITVVMDSNYPPYVFRDDEGDLKGILIDQWALWSKKTGVEAMITAMNWPDALAAMKNGEYNVIDTVFLNEERDVWLDFGAPYVKIDVAVFQDKAIGGITDIRSMRGFAIAAKAEDNSVQLLMQNGIEDIVKYSSYEAIIDAAAAGETRVFVMDEPPAMYFLYKKDIAAQFNRGITIDSGAFHRAVKSGDAGVLRMVEDGFAAISKAEYQAIDEAWFGKPSVWTDAAGYLRYMIMGVSVAAVAILFITVWNYRLRKAVQTKTAELYEEKELMQVTIQSIGDGVVATDIRGNVTLINPTARALTGWGDDAINQPVSKVVCLINSETAAGVKSPVERVLQSGEIAELADHAELLSRSGERIPVSDFAAPIRGNDNEILGVVMTLKDFRKEKSYRERIESIMIHDSMTGLFNRWYMEETMKRCERDTRSSCTLIMGDMNGLKLVNDAFGHAAGDVIIKRVAQIMKQSCGPDDIVGRWGGDEFLVILPRADAQEAEALMARIQAGCAEQSDERNPLSISMGYALKDGETYDIRSVLRDAEQWAYRRKLMIEKSFRNSMINALLSTLSAKNGETEEHAMRLQDLCARVGAAINISSKEKDEMSLLAVLHDIGKVGINDSTLQKPGPLSPDEWLEMHRHPEIGYRIAQNNIDLAPISECILSHHERWDGSGYPRGLRGEEIPILSRILAVVDAFDAMTNDRVYRKAVCADEAAAEIVRNAGTQFDPAIARVFVEEVLGMAWRG
ncbi:MAG: HD domain-containing phosphohydrolase [Christensenellales bacterium]